MIIWVDNEDWGHTVSNNHLLKAVAKHRKNRLTASLNIFLLNWYIKTLFNNSNNNSKMITCKEDNSKEIFSFNSGYFVFNFLYYTSYNLSYNILNIYYGQALTILITPGNLRQFSKLSWNLTKNLFLMLPWHMLM